MAEIPGDLLYTAEHEYLRASDEDDVYFVGITDYAQGELGDVVFVELPAPGDSFNKMQVYGTIEAVKAVSDLYCPLAGEIVTINEGLEEDPSVVNSDPYGGGWMIQLRVTDPTELAGLLSASVYEAQTG